MYVYDGKRIIAFLHLSKSSQRKIYRIVLNITNMYITEKIWKKHATAFFQKFPFKMSKFWIYRFELLFTLILIKISFKALTSVVVSSTRKFLSASP